MKLHHIGFAVPSIAAVIEGFAHSLSRSWDGKIFHDPLQGVRVAFLASTLHPEEPLFELVEPADEKSPVKGFLSRGGGPYHLCYEVMAPLVKQLESARAVGALIVKQPLPAVAFDNRQIAWIYTRERVLVEYLEREGPCDG